MTTWVDALRLAWSQDEEVRKATADADRLWDMFDARGMVTRSQLWDTLFRRVIDLINTYGGNAAKRAADWYRDVRPWPDDGGAYGFHVRSAHFGVWRDPVYKSLQWACRPFDDGPDGREKTKARVREVVERNVREAGQDTLRYNASYDPFSDGWIIMPMDTKACAWCTTLAGHPMYGKDDDLPGRHVKCRCQVVPVFHGQPVDYPGRKRYREMYETVSAACGPNASMQTIAANMRRLYPWSVTDPALGIPASSDFAKTLGLENVAKINGLLADTKHKMTAKVWVANIIDYDFGDSELAKGTAQFNPYSGEIDINLRRTSLGMDSHYPYQTLLHETAHALDYWAGSSDYFSREYRDKDGMGFAKALRLDAQDALERTKTKYWQEDRMRLERIRNRYEWSGSIDEPDLDWLRTYEFITSDNDILDPSSLAEMPRRTAYRHLTEDLHSRHLPADCDVENVLHYGLGDDFNEFQVSKHPIGYYTGTHGQRRHIVETEAFAEMMAAQLADEDGWAVFVEYCPRGYRMYENMVRELWKKAQK